MSKPTAYILTSDQCDVSLGMQIELAERYDVQFIPSCEAIHLDSLDKPLLQPTRHLIVIPHPGKEQELADNLKHHFCQTPLRTLFALLIYVKDCNAEVFLALTNERDDVIFQTPQPGEVLFRIQKNHQKCDLFNKLSRDLQEASDIALLSMSHSSELGEISRFILRSYQCKTYDELLDALFDTTDLFGVKCSALIMVDDKVCIREAQEVGFRTREIMLRLHNQKRIHHMGQDVFISFTHASMLIHNMPTDHDHHFGRLLDNLTILGNCFEARVKGIHAEEEAESASRAKTLFLATMSHELRTPMNSVIGFTGRLIKKLDGRISEKEFRHLQAIKRNGDHLLNIINDILDMSKIEVGAMEIHPEEINPLDLINEVYNQLLPIARNANLDFKLHVPESSQLIQADPTRFTQMVMNLTSNAIKYTESGSVEIDVKFVDDTKVGLGVAISVADTGLGISIEDQKRLFGNFVQIDSARSRKVEGTGLGLAITLVFANMHGGRIDLQSELGKGSCFTLVLPQKAPDITQPPMRITKD